MSEEISIITLKDLTGRSFDFSTIKSLSSFLKKEMEFWSRIDEKTELGAGFNSYNSLVVINPSPVLGAVLDIIKNNSTLLETLKSSPEEIKNYLAKFNNSFQYITPRWIWSGHPYINETFRILKNSLIQYCCKLISNILSYRKIME